MDGGDEGQGLTLDESYPTTVLKRGWDEGSTAVHDVGAVGGCHRCLIMLCLLLSLICCVCCHDLLSCSYTTSPFSREMYFLARLGCWQVVSYNEQRRKNKLAKPKHHVQVGVGLSFSVFHLYFFLS